MAWLVPRWVLAAALCSAAEAQYPAGSVFDEAEDPVERAALKHLYQTSQPAERARRAEAFLAAYSKSWFRWVALEIAARAYTDLGDSSNALRAGRASLEILPENPVLRVIVANVAVKERLVAEAERHARSALEDLDRFAPPVTLGERAWPEIRRRLRASALYVLGRASATEALGGPTGEKQASLLSRAMGHLAEARELAPEDPEIPKLVDIIRPLTGTALVPRTLVKLPAQSRNPQPASTYAGSLACRPCHGEAFRAWEQTGMARMFRPYLPDRVIGDFTGNNRFFAGEEARLELNGPALARTKGDQVAAKMVIDGGRHYFDLKDAEGEWKRHAVDYLIGSKWQQAYATRLPNGEVFVLPIQYNVLLQRWVNFWEFSDTARSQRASVEGWHSLDASTNYSRNCAVCHTSQLRAATLGFREAGVNCEMCHGPSALHVESMKRGEPLRKRPLETPVGFSRIAARDYNAICAQCHMQSAARELGPGGEVSFLPGASEFAPALKRRPYGEFSRRGFYKDGRFRHTTFIIESLERTACWQKGEVHCGNCHNPHPVDAGSNGKSLKFRERPDEMCLQCHSQYRERATMERHTRHGAASEGSRCASCHMPRIQESLLFLARTHQFDDVPRAEPTLRYGQRESPNACLLCHTDKDAQWLLRQEEARRDQPQARP